MSGRKHFWAGMETPRSSRIQIPATFPTPLSQAPGHHDPGSKHKGTGKGVLFSQGPLQGHHQHLSCHWPPQSASKAGKRSFSTGHSAPATITRAKKQGHWWTTRKLDSLPSFYELTSLLYKMYNTLFYFSFTRPRSTQLTFGDNSLLCEGSPVTSGYVTAPIASTH